MQYEKCDVCTRDIRVMAFMGTGVCCDLCRKKRDGDDKPIQPVRVRKGSPPPMMVNNSIVGEVEHP